MAKCKNCKNLLAKREIKVGHIHSFRWCPIKHDNPDVEMERDCDDYECMTNADRIRSMTDEELAEFLFDFSDNSQPSWDVILEWLKSEVGCE